MSSRRSATMRSIPIARRSIPTTCVWPSCACSKPTAAATATWYAFTGTTIPGVVTANNGGLVDVGNIDGTSSADLTTAERLGVQIATDFVRIARQWRIPGLRHCHLQRVGGAVAVRESRRVIGEHVLTAEDIRTRRHFADAVSRRYEGYMDTVYFHREGSSGTGIPYRCLTSASDG